jgi:hypothetical protein
MTFSWKHIIPTSVKKAGRNVLERTVTLAFRVRVLATRGRARRHSYGYGSSLASKNSEERFWEIYYGIMHLTSGLSFAKKMVTEFRSRRLGGQHLVADDYR